MRAKFLAAILLCGCLTGAQAQMAGVQGGAASAGTQEAPSKALVDMLGMFEGEMLSAAKAMPAEKYDFTPASLNIPGAKYDGVRTFAAEVKHVAQANFFFAMTFSGMKPDADMKAIGAMKSKEDIVSALEGSFAFLHKAMGTLTVANSFETVPFEGATATKATVAAFAVAHGFDHYGQMVEYLRMNGITPPASAK